MSTAGESMQRTLPVAILALALVIVPVLVLAPEGLPHLRTLQNELDRVHADNDQLRRHITTLRAEVTRLRENPATLEHIARDELGMVRKNEVVFQFDKR